MKSTTTLKTITTTVFGVLNSIFGILTTPLLLMLCCNIIDYATGLMKAKKTGEGIASYKSIEGITKKITMWLLVAVGAIMDRLLMYAADTIGYEIKITFLFAGMVAIWIVCNEIISILENVVAIGVKIPAFLLPVVKNLKTQVESVGETVKMEETEESEEVAK